MYWAYCFLLARAHQSHVSPSPAFFLPRTPQGNLRVCLLAPQAAVTKMVPSLGFAQARAKVLREN